MTKLFQLLRREPVRVYLYSVLGAVLLLLIGIGVVTASTAALIGGVAVAVLAVPGTEALRSQVYAPATVDQIRADLPAPDEP